MVFRPKTLCMRDMKKRRGRQAQRRGWPSGHSVPGWEYRSSAQRSIGTQSCTLHSRMSRIRGPRRASLCRTLHGTVSLTYSDRTTSLASSQVGLMECVSSHVRDRNR